MTKLTDGARAIDIGDNEILFIGAIPAKKNSKEIVRWRLLPSKRYREWHSLITSSLWEMAPIDIDWPLYMEIDFIVGDRHRRDLDNAVSSIQDTLVDVGYLTDDNCSILKKLTVTNLWYIRNLYLTRVKFTPYTISSYNCTEDHKDKTIDELVHIAHHLFN